MPAPTGVSRTHLCAPAVKSLVQPSLQVVEGHRGVGDEGGLLEEDARRVLLIRARVIP
jgi:hypothetical protein